MNRIIRGIITGSVVGAAVGVTMLAVRSRSRRMNLPTDKVGGRARGAIHLVKDNAIRLTSALKSGTASFSRKLARRSS